MLNRFNSSRVGLELALYIEVAKICPIFEISSFDFSLI